MEIINKPTFTGRTALWYVTVGSIMMVWATIWYTWLYRHPSPGEAQWYICTGTFLTGVALVIIGMCAGPITQLYTKEAVPTPAAHKAAAAEHAVPPVPAIQPIIVTAAPPPAPAPAPAAPPPAPAAPQIVTTPR